MPGHLCTAPRIISLSPLSLATDVPDATLGASGLWLGTRTGAGGTAALTECSMKSRLTPVLPATQAMSIPFCTTVDLQLSFYRPLGYNSRAHCLLLQCRLTTSAILVGARSNCVMSAFKYEGSPRIFTNGYSIHPPVSPYWKHRAFTKCFFRT